MARFTPHFLDELRTRLPVSEVVGQRVKLRKAGGEFKGLSPFNKETTPSFFVNDKKMAWFDFSSNKNGTIFDFVMLTQGLSFPEAVKELARMAGMPLPADVNVREWTAEERARFDAEEAARRAENERWRAEREREDAMDEAARLETAGAIWKAAVDITGTAADRYLNLRGLPTPPEGWPSVLRFSPSLGHPDGNRYPCLIARVDDVCGELCGIWRIYLDPKTGNKIENDAKLGLGSTKGGAVRIGGIGEKVGAAEGIESALGAWFLVRRRYPVWAVLSTSGMMNFEPPLEVKCIAIFLDGDRPKVTKLDGDQIALAEDATPAGRKAACVLHDRMMAIGIKAPIQAEPRPAGSDYLDVWNRSREVAA